MAVLRRIMAARIVMANKKKTLAGKKLTLRCVWDPTITASKKDGN
jgi:hypothetical protein